MKVTPINQSSMVQVISDLILERIANDGIGAHARLARAVGMSPTSLSLNLKGQQNNSQISTARFNSLMRIAEYMDLKVYFKTPVKTYDMAQSHEEILEDLRYAIVNSQMTHRQLAEQTGCTPSMISMIASNSEKCKSLGILSFIRVYAIFAEQADVEILDKRRRMWFYLP